MRVGRALMMILPLFRVQPLHLVARPVGIRVYALACYVGAER